MYQNLRLLKKRQTALKKNSKILKTRIVPKKGQKSLKKSQSKRRKILLKSPKHKPVRRCVICRGSFLKEDLSRFVRQEGRLLEGRTLPGRGLYLCDSPECRKKFERKYVS
ncbi:YlxR family protein [Candidatus Mcinerneyibacteriota bacterium]|nr:YlxR family protein [Candidatus Mcinerneyibacteriota bacterium]